MSEPEIELHTKIETPDSKGLSVVRELIVHQSVLDAMAGHVTTDTTVENGGVMLGSVDDTTGAVTITGSIAAVGAVSRVASLTFTHETWDHISEVQERSYPDTKMVGWYHSHPHFGIFLSDHDLFIHRNFFKEPWQVAYVIDPLLHQEGFFVWEDGDVARLPAWRVITDGGTAQGHLGVQEPARGMVPPPPPPVKKAGGTIIGMIAIALVALLVGGATGYAISDSGAGDAPPAAVAITRPPVNVWRVADDGEVPLGYKAGQITAAGDRVWCAGPSGYWPVEPPDGMKPAQPEPLAIGADANGNVWAVVRKGSGLTVRRGKRSADLEDEGGTPVIAVSAMSERAWVAAGPSITRLQPGNQGTSLTVQSLSIPAMSERSASTPPKTGPDAPVAEAGTKSGNPRPSLPAVKELAAWGQEVVALVDGTMYVQENETLRPDVRGVHQIAASGDDLWYLTENALGVVLHHRLKGGITWEMRVGQDARIAAAPGYLWVTKSLEGSLFRVSADGGVRATDHQGPLITEPLAASPGSLWALTKRTTATGGSVAWRYRMDDSTDLIRPGLPVTTSTTATTTTTKPAVPSTIPKPTGSAPDGEGSGGSDPRGHN